MLHVVPTEASELPEGQDWIFVETDGELYTLLSEDATGEAMTRGWEIAKGLLKECEERKMSSAEFGAMLTEVIARS